jgi:SAM-dependent methyltransferase
VSRDAFWEDPERVQAFAAREPDHRLIALLCEYPDPSTVRVLDLGCAGGRNTRILVQRGFDVVAVDLSAAMVATTRSQVAELISEAEAERRVIRGPMDDLEWARDGSFDLIVALGIYHEAQDEDEWDRAIAETARVLRPGGTALVSVFSPGTILHGVRFVPVAGGRFLYRSETGEITRSFPTATQLDREMVGNGLAPVVETVTVRREVEDSVRVVTNGLYRKA